MADEMGPETNPETAESPEAQKGFYAFDLQKLFANQVHTFANGSVTIFVFREIIAAIYDNGKVINPGIARNIASIVLPTDVAVDFAKSLNAIIEFETTVKDQSTSGESQ